MIVYKLEAANAREGIKTLSNPTFPTHVDYLLEAANAREGIKTSIAPRINNDRPLMALEAANAREGIKTHF